MTNIILGGEYMPITIRDEKGRKERDEVLSNDDVINVGLFIRVWQDAKKNKENAKNLKLIQNFLTNPNDRNKTKMFVVIHPDRFLEDRIEHENRTKLMSFINGLTGANLYRMQRIMNRVLGNKVKLGKGGEPDVLENTDFDNKDAADIRNAILNSKILRKFDAELKANAEQKKVEAKQEEQRTEALKAKGRAEYKKGIEEAKARAKAEGKPLSETKREDVLERKRRESKERKQREQEAQRVQKEQAQRAEREQQERQRAESEARKQRDNPEEGKEEKKEKKKTSKEHDFEMLKKLGDVFQQSFAQHYLYQKKKFAHVFWTYKIRDHQLEFLDKFRRKVYEDFYLSVPDKIKLMSAAMDFMVEDLELEQKEHWTKAQSRLKSDVDERKRNLNAEFKDILPTTSEQKEEDKRKMLDFVKKNRSKGSEQVLNEDARLKKKFKH